MSGANALFIAGRKFRSAMIRAHLTSFSMARQLAVRLWWPSVSFGSGVRIGRNVRFRVLNGGKVVLGDGVSLEDSCRVYAAGGFITIGPNAFIGWGTEIVALESIEIGADSLIASFCVIRDGNHRFDDRKLIREQGHTINPISIERDVWIGSHVAVLPGARIGEWSVIGAHSVVRGLIPRDSIAVGAPARVKRGRYSGEVNSSVNTVQGIDVD